MSLAALTAAQPFTRLAKKYLNSKADSRKIIETQLLISPTLNFISAGSWSRTLHSLQNQLFLP